MRLLFIILAFVSLSAEGQILNASAPYRVRASCSKLLDCYSGAAAAYSLRLLDADYAGDAIRVRRSSDNTESDIGFTAGGDLDTAALKTFVGTGGTDDGLVVTFYDQSGNSRDAAQATSFNQPYIMDNGGVVRNDGNPAIVFAGAQYLRTSATAFMSLATHSDFLVVSQYEYKASVGYLVWEPATGNDYERNDAFEIEGNATPNNLGVAGGAGIAYNIVEAGSSTLYQLVSHVISSGSGELWQNGTSAGTDSYGSFTTMGGALLMGARFIGGAVNTASYGLKGYVQEMVVYASDQSANRTSIQTNINTYWQVY